MNKDELVEKIKGVLIDALEQDQRKIVSVLGDIVSWFGEDEARSSWMEVLVASNAADISAALREVANTLRGGDPIALTLSESILVETYLSREIAHVKDGGRRHPVSHVNEMTSSMQAELEERLAIVVKKLVRAREKKAS